MTLKAILPSLKSPCLLRALERRPEYKLEGKTTKFFAGRAFGCAGRAFRAPNDGIFSGPIADDDGYGGYHGKYCRILDDTVGDEEEEDGDGEGRRRTKTMRRTKKGMSKARSGSCHPREFPIKRHTNAQKQKVIVLCRVAFCTFQHLVLVLCRLCVARRARHYVTRINGIEAQHYSLGPECAAQYNRQDDTHTIGSASRQPFFFIYDLCIIQSVKREGHSRVLVCHVCCMRGSGVCVCVCKSVHVCGILRGKLR